MKSYRKELWFDAPNRRALINVTDEVEKCLAESGVREGLCLVNAMHITASVFINDNESGLHADFEKWLEALAPENRTDSIFTIGQVKITQMPTLKRHAVQVLSRPPARTSLKKPDGGDSPGCRPVPVG